MEKTKKTFAVRQWVRDLGYGIFLVIFSIANMIYAGTLPEGSIKIKAAQAGTYLTIVMVMLLILGIALILRSLIKKPDKLCEPIFNSATLVTVGWMALYLIALPKIGFFIASFLFVFGLVAYYSWKQGKLDVKGKELIKKIAAYTICAAATTFVCYILFAKVLTVVLPQFTLFN